MSDTCNTWWNIKCEKNFDLEISHERKKHTWMQKDNKPNDSDRLYVNFELRHRRCVGSITKNFVYYTYSQTQLYFNY